MLRGGSTKTWWRTYFTNDLREAAMTIAIDRPICPCVFDADLPKIDYEVCRSPDEAHEIIRPSVQISPGLRRAQRPARPRGSR